MDKELAEGYYRRANQLFAAGQLDDALADLNALAQAFPKDPTIQYARARCFAAHGGKDTAMSICQQLVAEHQHKRAGELLAELNRPSCAALPTSVTEGPPNAPERRVRWTRVLIVAAVAVIGAGVYYQAVVWSEQALADANQRAVAADLGSRAARPKSSAPAGIQAPQAAVIDLREHLQTEWMQTAISGVPDWKSGIYRRVPNVRDNKWTIDVFLPTAYDAQPESAFPVVFIQMPQGNPGFMELDGWAERRQVILIVMNESMNRNKGHMHYNEIAQEMALETINQGMRIDRRLGFAMGTSGGGKSSWYLVSRYPQNFAGLLMMAMSDDNKSSYIPPRIRVAYVHGESDFNNPYIAKKIPKLRAAGHQVREKVIPGGHVSGRYEDMVEMLDWLVTEARKDIGLPLP
ncbi:MAG: tetratricopeptide repeat protein [Candidatus Hydrogenedentes bacterium]|nr:tetratricopeptide repeat protein [Candidatus Hydrogenedentota bacterium]